MPREGMMTVTIENARLIYRNFAGKENMYNLPGSKNFSVVLDPKTAEEMAKDGWNVKFPEPREEGEERDPHLQVQLGYKYQPPRIVMITSTGRTPLDEHSVEILDWADIQNVDLIINASHWSNNGKSGIKAYLKTMFIIINEDELERKYALMEQEEGR